MPSSGSSGSSSSRNSRLHCHRRASVTVGDIWIQMGGVRDRRGGIGKGCDWEE